MTSIHNSFSSARQFMRDHAVQLRGDALNLQQIRQSNFTKFQTLKQQNAMISNLKTSLIQTKRQLQHSSFYVEPDPSSSISFRKNSSASTSSASLCSSINSCYSTSTTSMKLNHLFQQKRRTSLWKNYPIQTENNIESEEEMLDRLHSIKKKDENRIRIIDIYIRAIESVQKHYRKVCFARFKDSLIKCSTMPHITYSNDETSAAYGLVKYPDRLLHAANLEDRIDRCLAKQQCIIHEATTKMPPSISLNMIPNNLPTQPSPSSSSSPTTTNNNNV